VVGYVGRLTHLKGVALLAAAFRELTRNAVDARLLIIGRGEEERSIRSILATELSRGFVHIEPDIVPEQLPQWYRAMDVLVMPSRYENFSNTVLEAMACGIPFLASNVGGNKMLEETHAGWLFQSESVASLCGGLVRVLENRSEMKDRGEVGSRYVRERYSWAASAERLESIIASHLRVKEERITFS
jgi:glycosyltransferase involved in cell wall biosynthesis